MENLHTMCIQHVYEVEEVLYFTLLHYIVTVAQNYYTINIYLIYQNGQQRSKQKLFTYGYRWRILRQDKRLLIQDWA
jgi:hypothetical protein